MTQFLRNLLSIFWIPAWVFDSRFSDHETAAYYAVRSGMAFGCVIAIALPIIIIATGQTFGGRCASAGFEGVAHEHCVSRLSKGEPM